MSLIGTNLKPVDLDSKIKKLESVAENCHRESILVYPSPAYQDLNTQSIKIQNAVLELRNIYDHWVFNSGYSNLRYEVDYYAFRIRQLQDFYLIVSDSDKQDILSVMPSLQETYLEKTRQVRMLENTEFQVELSEELVLLINKI